MRTATFNNSVHGGQRSVRHSPAANACSRRLTVGALWAVNDDALRQAASCSAEDIDSTSGQTCLNRRHFLGAVVATSLLTVPYAQADEEAGWQQYRNAKQNYSMQLPAAWTAKEKAGADALFEDPARTSTNVGVTVAPVRVKVIEDFGSVETVGTKLLETEKAKESTLSVELLTSGARTLDSGVILYDYEYEIESTRGRKRILNSVTIAKSKLYIFNAQVKCGKESCSGQDLDLISELRRIALTFYVA